MARSARPTKRLRVRSKLLDQVDESKLALALWLMAKDVLAEEKDESRPASNLPPLFDPDTPDDAEAA